MLASVDSHPTPEAVYSSVREDLPNISLATVYKILDVFHRERLVNKVSFQGQTARYDANLSDHHHLVCSQCGNIQDVVEAPLQTRHPIGNDAPGFQVSRLEVIAHGTCADCLKAGNQP